MKIVNQHTFLCKELKGYAVIYMFTSSSGKSYIGQTFNFGRRYKEHERKRLKNKFSHAIVKYGGLSFFKVSILFKEEITDNIVDMKNRLNEREIFFISKYNTLIEGYNLTAGGQNEKDQKVTEESLQYLKTIAKIAAEKRIVERVTVNCSLCEKEFTLREAQINYKKKYSNSIFCSRSCAGKNATQIRDLLK